MNSPGDDAGQQQTTTSVDDRDSKVTSFCYEEQDRRVLPQFQQMEIQATSCAEQEQKQEDASSEAAVELLPADDDGEADKQNSSSVEVVAGFHGVQTQHSVTVELSKQQTVDQLQQQCEPDQGNETSHEKENGKDGAAVAGKDQEQRTQNVEQKMDEEERDIRDELKMGASEDADDEKGEDAKEKATVEEFQKEDIRRRTEQEQSGEGFEEVVCEQKDEDEETKVDDLQVEREMEAPAAAAVEEKKQENDGVDK